VGSPHRGGAAGHPAAGGSASRIPPFGGLYLLARRSPDGCPGCRDLGGSTYCRCRALQLGMAGRKHVRRARPTPRQDHPGPEQLPVAARAYRRVSPLARHAAALLSPVDERDGLARCRRTRRVFGARVLARRAVDSLGGAIDRGRNLRRHDDNHFSRHGARRHHRPQLPANRQFFRTVSPAGPICARRSRLGHFLLCRAGGTPHGFPRLNIGRDQSRWRLASPSFRCPCLSGGENHTTQTADSRADQSIALRHHRSLLHAAKREHNHPHPFRKALQ
jgi:hypothetical protein